MIFSVKIKYSRRSELWKAREVSPKQVLGNSNPPPGRRRKLPTIRICDHRSSGDFLVCGASLQLSGSCLASAAQLGFRSPRAKILLQASSIANRRSLGKTSRVAKAITEKSKVKSGTR